MVLNAHLLVKLDATSRLSTDLLSNRIDVCIISETWLNSRVLSHLVCPDGYNCLPRKDWGNQYASGGVSRICRNDWKIKHLEFDNQFECLWSEVFTVSKLFQIFYHFTLSSTWSSLCGIWPTASPDRDLWAYSCWGTEHMHHNCYCWRHQPYQHQRSNLSTQLKANYYWSLNQLMVTIF